MEEIKNDETVLNFKCSLVSLESIDQLLKASELKYIDHIIEVEEEQKLVDDNIKDFSELPEEVQKKAMEEYPKAQADQDYFEREGADKSLAKPMMILSNIDVKKNEVKIKTWKIEYYIRTIKRLKAFKETKLASK